MLMACVHWFRMKMVHFLYLYFLVLCCAENAWRKHWYEKTCIENCRLFSFSCVQTINCQIKTSFWFIFVAECNEITMRWNRHFIINVGRVHLQTKIIDMKSIMLHNCYSWILVSVMYKNGTYQNQDYSLLQMTRSGYRNEYQI